MSVMSRLITKALPKWGAAHHLLIPTTVLALAITGCSGSSSGGSGGGGDDDEARVYVGTQSPGYLWSFTLTDSEWSASNESEGFTYAGTVDTMDNRFQLLTVTESNDPDTDTDGSAAAFALEVPQVLLLVQPKGDGDSQMIVGVAQGDCPTEDSTHNWITMPQLSWNSASSEAYGTASFEWSGSTASVEVSPYTLEDEPLAGVAGNASCADGVIEADEVTIGITESGTLIGNNGDGDGGFVGILAPDEAVGTASLADPAFEYRGLVFEYEREGGDDTKPVWARYSDGSLLEAGDYTDFESNDENTAETSSISLDTEPAPGRIEGTVNGDPPQTLVFAVGEIGGRYFIFGIGNAPDSSSPYNVLLIEVD